MDAANPQTEWHESGEMEFHFESWTSLVWWWMRQIKRRHIMISLYSRFEWRHQLPAWSSWRLDRWNSRFVLWLCSGADTAIGHTHATFSAQNILVFTISPIARYVRVPSMSMTYEKCLVVRLVSGMLILYFTEWTKPTVYSSCASCSLCPHTIKCCTNAVGMMMAIAVDDDDDADDRKMSKKTKNDLQ